ncbi:MAG: two-component system cell cycle sensor histidine kinase/response regulator CckA [Verrucomicrobiales bacterium]|jgi:two-component system cell cycle sensor histidine kinase/response regulator CckA
MPSTNSELTQLRNANHHLRIALSQIDEGVVIVGAAPMSAPGPQILFANRRAAEITGFSESELVGQQVGLIYEAKKLDELLTKLPLVAEKNRTFQTEKLIQCKDGSTRTGRWTICPAKDANGQPLNYTLTFRENVVPETPEAPQPSDESLQEKSRLESLALLSGGVAHDFNNFLTTIIGSLSLARLGTSVRDSIRQHIDDAAVAAESAEALTKLLLGFAKGTTPSRRELDLGRLVKKAARLATMGSNTKCDFNVATTLWAVEADETQILQVFHNLIVNACQAMPTGGLISANCDNVTIDNDTSLGIRPGAYVKVSVRDRGFGIAKENLDHIFDAYFTTKDEGTGLGLATCYMNVQRHDGTMSVRSKVDVGTEFSVYLPASGKLTTAIEVEPPEKVFEGDGAILVVDDEKLVRHVAVEILKRLGYDAIEAISGEEALELYSKRLHTDSPVAAVLMDMTLPGGKNGHETMAEIQRLDPDVRTIATSGSFEGSDHSDLWDRGYVGVLPKPYSVESLSAALHTALAE